jgi:type IV pilus assembly protein PilC
MPSYYYRARDANGRAHEGIEVATSEEDVLRLLEGQQLVPVFIEARAGEAMAAPGARPSALQATLERAGAGLRQLTQRVQPGAVALFARQLATMIQAGLPMVRSLRSIARDHFDRRLGAVLQVVSDDVAKGESLATALGRHPAVFDEVFVSLVHTGEVSGTLDRVMDQTAGYLERAEALRVKVESALRYPIFVLSFALLVLAAMILKIIPEFAKIYTRFQVTLPGPTRALLATSEFVTSNLLVLSVLGAAGAVAVWYWAQSEAGRFALDRAKFNLPLFGELIRMYAMTKFARTLGMLTSSGTQILYALKVMRPVPGNRVLERGIDQVRSRVEEGSSLSRAMEETGVFPDMLMQMTSTGEETGKLDQMLTRTADFYEQRVTAKVEGLSSLIEPIAIVVLGVVVGVMLLALYLPIFNLGQAMRTGMIGR